MNPLLRSAARVVMRSPAAPKGARSCCQEPPKKSEMYEAIAKIGREARAAAERSLYYLEAIPLHRRAFVAFSLAFGTCQIMYKKPEYPIPETH